MKTQSCLIMLIALAASSAPGQPREGKTRELGLSGSYQHYSTGSGSGTSGAFLVSPRLGFFLVEGLEVEPELLLMLASGTAPVYMLNGNISYNFLPAGRTFPFLLAGFGVANTVPFFNVPFTRTDFSVGVLNLGAGIKAFLGEDVAIRLEYRFQQFKGEGEAVDYGFAVFTRKVNSRLHTVQFGFSVLL